MMRRYINLDGEILAEEQWIPTGNKNHKCFWCDDHLSQISGYECPYSFDGTHEWVTICHREYA